MRTREFTGILLTMLFLAVVSPIGASVGEGKHGGMLGQHESLQAYLYSEPPDTEWNQTYGGIAHDEAYSGVQTSEGGYALAGVTESFGAGMGDFWLVKTDSSGNHLWNQTYGGAGWDFAHCVVETSDGGFALAGGTESFGEGYTDFWLVKVDSSGNHLWNQTYGGDLTDEAFCVVETSDGGYAVAGVTDSFGAGAMDFWLVKVDSSGNHLWNQTYGGVYIDHALSVVETSDSGFALAGGRESFEAGPFDFWLVKVDSSGNHLWNQTYGGADLEFAESVVETSDGGYALAGSTESFEAGPYDFWLVKVDFSGNHLWNQTYGGADHEFALCVVETSDGGYALAGGTDSFQAGDSDSWLVKTDAAGNMLWNKTCGGTGDDIASSVVETSDGGYALAGGTESFGAGGADFWLVKLAPEEVGVDWWPMFHHDPSHTGYSTSTAPNTNNTVWSYTTGDAVYSSPAVADGRVYVGSHDNKVYCLNASNGVHIWNYTTGFSVESSPAVADGKVYVGSGDNKVYCLNASNGVHIWSYQAGGWVVSSPAVADGKVYVGSLLFGFKVYCLNASNGVHIWSYNTSFHQVGSSPAVADGKVYVGSEDGNVYAFGSSDVAVTDVSPSKTVVGQGLCMSINVTVDNQGDFDETFSVKAYYGNDTITSEQWETFWSMGDVNRDGYINSTDEDLIVAASGSTPVDSNWCSWADLDQDLTVTIVGDWMIWFAKNGSVIWDFISGAVIETQTVFDLQSGTNVTLSFTWNTTLVDKDNYIISAYATPIFWIEHDRADNSYGDGWVVVALTGDVNADGIVNIYDLAAVARLYMKFKGDPDYDPNLDPNCDGVIDMRDLSIIGRNYGKKDP